MRARALRHCLVLGGRARVERGSSFWRAGLD
jgi:hypothetical protein